MFIAYPLCMVILLGGIANILSEAATTTCNVRPDFSNYSTPTTGNALSGSLYLDINNPFTCYGIIKQWRFCYKRSPGIQSDTLKIGLYQLQQNLYVKRGSNSIYIQLKDSDCLTVDANPQLVVEQGYMVAFIATSAYIKFYDDDQNGHLFKTVAFPNQVSPGILIKTTNTYAPKLQGYVEKLQTTTSISTSSVTSTHSHERLSTVTSFLSSSYYPSWNFSSSPILPAIISNYSSLMPVTSVVTSPLPSSSGIPYPSVETNQCVFGVRQGYASSYSTKTSWFLNKQQPCACNGMIIRWELCHSPVSDANELSVGVWRKVLDEESYKLVGENIVTLYKTNHSSNVQTPLLECNTIAGDIMGVSAGDLIGFLSPNVSIAFARDFAYETQQVHSAVNSVPLLRAIISKTVNVMSTVRPPFTTASFTSTASGTPNPQTGKGNTTLLVAGTLSVGCLTVLVILIVSIVVILRMKHAFKYRTFLQHSRDASYMTYNVNYIPSNPEEIIINSRKESLKFGNNPSYASSRTFGDLPPTNITSSDHVYESV